MKAGKKAIVTAAKKSDQAVTAAGKSAGHAVLHPSQTLRGAGQAVKTAAIGGAVGYVGWEKLTSDKSVARIVSDAVVGESVTNAIAGTADGVRELAGILTGRDALEFIMAGAAAVQVGTANFLDPKACTRITAEIGEWMDAHGVKTLDEIRGCARG